MDLLKIAWNIAAIRKLISDASFLSLYAILKAHAHRTHCREESSDRILASMPSAHRRRRVLRHANRYALGVHRTIH